MNRRCKNTEDDIEQMQQKGDEDACDKTSGFAGEAVCDVGQHDGGHADRHDARVGDDVSEVLEHLQGRQESPGDKQRRDGDARGNQQRDAQAVQ